ncbi:MAG: DUF503 domain-containing protein [Cellulosilyticaceae bacterium]
MNVGVCEIKLRAVWVQSLKEKRMVVRRITERVANKFNVSIAEIEDLDKHQSIIIGIAVVSNSREMVQKILDQVVDFVESITDAEVLDVDIEVIN